MSTPDVQDPVTRKVQPVDEHETRETAMRPYLSSQHLWTAGHCARLAAEFEDAHAGSAPTFYLHQRGYVLAAVTEAASFLESLINEFFEGARQVDSDYLAPLSSDVRIDIAAWWHANRSNRSCGTLKKYSEARCLANVIPSDPGAPPHQDAQLLVDLRNWMLRYTPTSANTITADPNTLESRLREKGLQSNKTMLGSGGPWFPDEALGAACAHWSVETVRAFADDFADTLKIEPNYRRFVYPDE